jgi:hypothetical protein
MISRKLDCQYVHLSPGVHLLLKRISILEKITVHELTGFISFHGKERPLEEAASLFCAYYFAQSATLSGHKAARHFQGIKSLEAVVSSMKINNRRYELAIDLLNDCTLSGHMVTT